jgi:hypothetical protein
LLHKIHGATVVQYAHDIFFCDKFFVATQFSITNNFLCHLQLFVCFCDELIIGFKKLFLFLFFSWVIMNLYTSKTLKHLKPQNPNPKPLNHLKPLNPKPHWAPQCHWDFTIHCIHDPFHVFTYCKFDAPNLYKYMYLRNLASNFFSILITSFSVINFMTFFIKEIYVDNFNQVSIPLPKDKGIDWL